MRSVVVVFPASICAMMPMLRQRSNGTVLGTSSCFLAKTLKSCIRRSAGSRLPPVVRERLVSFRHAVDVFLLLDGCAAVVGGVQQFVGELLCHAALVAPPPAVANQPAQRQR